MHAQPHPSAVDVEAARHAGGGHEREAQSSRPPTARPIPRAGQPAGQPERPGGVPAHTSTIATRPATAARTIASVPRWNTMHACRAAIWVATANTTAATPTPLTRPRRCAARCPATPRRLPDPLRAPVRPAASGRASAGGCEPVRGGRQPGEGTSPAERRDDDQATQSRQEQHRSLGPRYPAELDHPCAGEPEHQPDGGREQHGAPQHPAVGLVRLRPWQPYDAEQRQRQPDRFPDAAARRGSGVPHRPHRFPGDVHVSRCRPAQP